MITMFYGVPGAGKTLAMQDYVAMHCDTHRFFVVDRVAEWGAADPDDDSRPNPRWRGQDLPIYIVPKDNIPDEFEPNGIYLFQYPWEGLEVAELAREVGNTTYVDDEIDMVATFKDWLGSPLRDFVHRGRHLPNAQGEICQANILGAARRPQFLHTDLTTLADQAFIFRVQGDKTLKRLVADNMIREEDISEVIAQPNLDYLLWRSDGSITKGRISNPFGKKARRL